MKYKMIIILSFIAYFHEMDAQRTSLDAWSKVLKDVIFSLIGRTANEDGFHAARRKWKIQNPVGSDVPFPCNTYGTRSAEPPQSVHELRPGDIDVIAGMGDSLTAANGAAASRFFHVGIENRGLAWSIGGQGTWREHLTLANILKEFNPKLFGFSVADSATHEKASQFNVAEPGSMSRDMPYMAKVLVKRIRADKRVNFDKDWKLITLMIGANDFCADICYKSDPSKTPHIHKNDLTKTLDYLRDNLPRALVNVVVPPNIDILLNFKGKASYCQAMHIAECPCVFGKPRLRSQKYFIKIMRQWQQVEEQLCLDARYQTKDDFTVVLQPFVTNLKFPERETPSGNLTDWTYLSEDCFHFSQKGYARASNALWNNMLEPIGQKSTDWTDTFSRFLCPTEDSPFIRTWKNSPNPYQRQIL